MGTEQCLHILEINFTVPKSLYLTLTKISSSFFHIIVVINLGNLLSEAVEITINMERFKGVQGIFMGTRLLEVYHHDNSIKSSIRLSFWSI